MALTDYQDVVQRLGRGLGKAYAADPALLNVPGRAIACKVDTDYYLALMPAFVETLARHAGVFPDTARTALIKTADLVTAPPQRDPVRVVHAWWGGRVYRLRAGFVQAGFIDRALAAWAGLPRSLEVSELKIDRRDKDGLDAFFEGKEPLKDLAFEG